MKKQPSGARNRQPNDPDLRVPAAQRARYEAAFARFCAVFPDAFYVSERGRNYLDPTKDKGRLLSAGFHNLMGYFRDDLPLYELILDEKGQKELDALWQELDFIASANVRTYVQFYFNEAGEAHGKGPESGALRPADKEVTSEVMIQQVKDSYLAKARESSNRDCDPSDRRPLPMGERRHSLGRAGADRGGTSALGGAPAFCGARVSASVVPGRTGRSARFLSFAARQEWFGPRRGHA